MSQVTEDLPGWPPRFGMSLVQERVSLVLILDEAVSCRGMRPVIRGMRPVIEVRLHNET